MKKGILILGFLILSISAFKAQSTVTGHGWLAGRHIRFNGTNGVNPLFFRTNALDRMKLNGNVGYSVAGFNQPRNGHLLLGYDMPSFPGGPNDLYSAFGAFSMLHLNGNIGTFAQQFGNRSWMKTGLTLTDNNDFTYFGLRQMGTGFDVTETVLAWADNSAPGISGPDDFALHFTGGNNSNVVGADLFAETQLFPHSNQLIC